MRTQPRRGLRQVNGGDKNRAGQGKHPAAPAPRHQTNFGKPGELARFIDAAQLHLFDSL